MKTYTLTCPDPECKRTFTVQLEPVDLEDGGDPIECPKCEEEWEWEHDLEADTLELVADPEEDDEESDDDQEEFED